jgi:hypothetical protein
MDQQGSPCYGSCKWLSERYDSKVTSVGQLDSKKLAASVLLYVFIIGIPAFPLSIKVNIYLIELDNSTDRLVDIMIN